MKIGIFDSGLGGLIVAKAVRKMLPEYDYVYLGDTKRVPYGNRSHQAVYEFTREAMEYLFRKENCALVIIACNTSSARALERIQREYLPKHFPKRKVLGVLIPTAEVCAPYRKVGVLATLGTVASNSFPREIRKAEKKTKVWQNPAPMLVPLIEEGDGALAGPFIKKYLQPFSGKKMEALVLGCTHYPIFKKQIKKEMKMMLGKNVKLLSQDEIVPKKFKDYLKKHKEIEKRLSKRGQAKILVTDITKNVVKLSNQWFGKIKPRLVHL